MARLGDLGSWTLRRRLGVLVWGLALLTVASTTYAVVSARNARDTATSEQHTLLPASTDAAALLSALVNQETGERGYVITGEPSLLDPYHEGQAQEASLTARLTRELAGMPDLDGQLRAVELLHGVWVNQIARREIADVAAGNTAAAVTLERSGQGTQQFDAIRRTVTALQHGIDAHAEQATATVDADLKQTFVFSIVRGVFLLVILFLVWLLIRRWVDDPLEQLAAEVQAVAAGDLDRTIEAQGPPEVSSLGRAIEAMRRRLRDEADELRQLRQSLAEHSPLHMLLGSELEASADVAYFSIAGRLLPAEGVLAGDWYDAWEMEGPRMAVAVVDISGHGPAAGLFALRMKHLLSPPLRAGMAPGAALGWVADECGETEEQFATAIVADLDVASGRCRYANAGHPDGLIVRADGIERLTTTGPLMCALPGSWGTGQVDIAPGDLLVLITDGVVEARLPDGSELGIDRVIQLVERHGPGAEPDIVAESIISAVREACVLPLRDDATVVVVRVGPPTTSPGAGVPSGRRPRAGGPGRGRSVSGTRGRAG
ncbi:MAG TPA: SpoIIE family protein phosphatase [Acidimicrobiales bacterium]|nr:SpoIIE family protein phosphatase [Acidimicrobiales bacterium]